MPGILAMQPPPHASTASVEKENEGVAGNDKEEEEEGSCHTAEKVCEQEGGHTREQVQRVLGLGILG